MNQSDKEKTVKEIVALLMLGVDKTKLKQGRINWIDMAILQKIKIENGHRVAIHSIMEQMKLSEETVDWIINKHIEKYQKSLGRGGLFVDTDPLSDASALIYYGASRNVIEKMIGLCAKQGWYGRTEGICRDLLCRDLNPTEIHALVDAYVSNRASRSTTQEEYLTNLAERCLDAEGARAVRMKVDGFIAEWNRQIDY